MGNGEKKEYRLLEGKPVLEHCITAFIQTGQFCKYIITVPPGHIGHVQEKISFLTHNISFIEGGTTRQESVFLGLKALEQEQIEYVLIHDGARPWVTPLLITVVLQAAQKHNACIPVVEIPDAPKLIDKNGYIEFHHKKHTLFGAQTPQGFSFPLILQAHRQAAEISNLFADDAEVYSILGKGIFTVPGEISNRKITYAHDLEAQ
ncbi:MAG: 2-C-methyl-D-erythritol 4-phosphate cytidylyltransferase [Spirochaetales bacterium]|nr:2-C-methyl-D-erythritol 4-phosphate cytidylyltransferase [Spirochaetales bacterium]